MFNLLSMPLIVIAAIFITEIYSSCIKSFTSPHRLDFNLSMFSLDKYNVLKYRQNYGLDDHIYFWNICGKPGNFPREACEKIDSSTVVAGAYQWSPGHHLNSTLGSCYRLSNEEGKEYQSYDHEDPTGGMSIEWIGGDKGCWPETYRSFKINFKCAWSLKDRGSQVSENNCKYELDIYSSANCPIGCAADLLGNLCGTKGICGYDHVLKRPRCYCYAGWQNDDCTKKVEYNINQLTPDSSADFDENDYYSKRFIGHTEYMIYDGLLSMAYAVIYKVDFDINGFVNKENPTAIYSNNDYFELWVGLLQNVDKTKINKDECKQINPPQNNLTYNSSIPITKADLQGYAFHYDRFTKTCISLGTKYNKENDWQMLDTKTDYAHGFKINYKEGSFCQQLSNGTVINYSMEIDFICPNSEKAESWDKNNHIIGAESSKFEDRCHFKTVIEHPLACPHQCRLNHEDNKVSVCSGKGKCLNDPNIHATRCVCDYGYYGNHCQTKNNSITLPPTKSPTHKPTSSPTNTKPTEKVPTSYPTGVKPTEKTTVKSILDELEEPAAELPAKESSGYTTYKVGFYILFSILIIFIIAAFIFYKKYTKKNMENDIEKIKMSNNDEFNDKPVNQDMIVIAKNESDNDNDDDMLPIQTATEVKDNGENQNGENK